MRITLYPYQREAVDAVHAAYGGGIRRPAVSAATGAGKTVVFSKVIEESGERTLVIAHRKEIIEQAAQKIGYVLPPSDIGIVMADRNQFDAPVVVASIQTIANPRRLARMGRFGLVVVDEAHHAASPSYIEVLRQLGVSRKGATKALGVSATWDRADNLGFEDTFEEIVYSIDIETLIASGHLSDIRALLIETHLDTAGVPGNGSGDFNAEALSRRIVDSDYADTLAAAVKQHAPDRHSLVFAPNVRTAELYRDALRAVGISAEMVHANTPRSEREEIVAALASGRLQVAVNCGVFTEGTDIPIVDCVVMGRPTKSRALYQQMAGRGLRRYPGKDACLILDLVGNAERLDLQSAASLIGRQRKPGQKEVRSFRELIAEPAEPDIKGELGTSFVQQAKPVELIDRKRLAWTQIDLSKSGVPVFSLPVGEAGQIVLQDDAAGAFNVVRFGRDRTREVLAEHMDIGYAQGIAEAYVAEAGVTTLVNPKARWRTRKEPATEKQLAALVKWKVPFEEGITKAEASDLLDQAITKANLRRRDWRDHDAQAS
jgi:ATP-dependent helicase IRC3